MTFNREQQQAARELLRAQLRWLFAYGWELCEGGRVRHSSAPATHSDYSVRDAIALTEAAPLRFAYRTSDHLKGGVA